MNNLKKKVEDEIRGRGGGKKPVQNHVLWLFL